MFRDHRALKGSAEGICRGHSCQSETHLHFAAGEAPSAFSPQPVEGDGVKLALVEVDHGQLAGLVLGGLGGTQGKLKLIPRKEIIVSQKENIQPSRNTFCLLITVQACWSQ